MADALSEKILAELERAGELYSRLLLVVAPSGAGKSVALKEAAGRAGARVLNLNLELSQRLLDLTERQRALQVPEVIEGVLAEDEPIVCLDNIEILFDTSLKQHPLRLLQQLARNRTVVAAWNGTVEEGSLVYAAPGHPEYRRYSAKDVIIVCPDTSIKRPEQTIAPQGKNER